MEVVAHLAQIELAVIFHEESGYFTHALRWQDTLFYQLGNAFLCGLGLVECADRGMRGPRRPHGDGARVMLERRGVFHPERATDRTPHRAILRAARRA